MAFTDLNTVKKHLLGSSFGLLEVRGYPVTLTGTDEAELLHHNLVEQSDTVKWDITIQPTRDAPVTLPGYDYSALSHEQVVPGTVVVTLTETLGTVYREEADYQVDYIHGQIRRVPGGMIPDGQPVVVYYNYYSTFERDTDYIIDWDGGTLRRTGGSAIPDGAQVLVDFDVTTGSVSDEMITQAIVEAEDRIVRALGAGYSSSSTDQGLVTGSTELVLAIVARDLAAESLARRETSDAAQRAREWQQVAELHETRAWEILRPFLEPYGLRSPGKSSDA